MRIETRALEAFASVKTLGTATAAAGVLACSQPAVTRSFQQLEERTGLMLFDRRGGRLMPTPEAHELYEDKRAALQITMMLSDHPLARRQGRR